MPTGANPGMPSGGSRPIFQSSDVPDWMIAQHARYMKGLQASCGCLLCLEGQAGRGGAQNERRQGGHRSHGERGGNPLGSGQHSNEQNPQVQAQASTWDASGWIQKYEHAKRARDDSRMRACLKEVAQSNYRLMQGTSFRGDVSRTDLVTHSQLQQRVQGHRQDPSYTISPMGTGDALLHFASGLKRSGGVVCALNFANGENCGGGYLRGARAQEEELCRQFPCMYTTLNRAKEYGHAYPFGAASYKGGPDPKRYADVLFTPRIVSRRLNQARGYAIIPESEVLDNMAVVSAAAPDVRKGKDKFDPELVLQAMASILLAPKLKDPRIDTLILGAWGCGAFGCDPNVMAKLFAQVLLKGGLGRLYREIHFAIPDGSDGNLRIFEAVLRERGVPLSGVSSM